MPADFEVHGAADFLTLSKSLKHAERTTMRRELTKGVRDATKPLLPEAAAALAASLPSGLQSRGRRVKQRVQVKTGNDPGVTIAVPYGRRGAGGLGASNARLANTQGLIRHPLFGDRENWYSTRVPQAQGWFDDYYSRQARRVLPEIESAMQRVIDQIVKEAR